MGAKRPLVLLDVDGVLNLGLFLSSRQRDRLVRGGGGWVSTWAGEPRYSQRVVTCRRFGPMLLELEALGAELAWASTWEHWANDCIAPRAGLPPLRVFRAPYEAKAENVIPLTGGRPWAWLDDDPRELEVAGELGRDLWPVTRPPCLPVLVDRAAGLSRAHVDEVARWLKSL